MEVDGVCRILLALMSADIEAQRRKHRESAGADAQNPHWVKVVVPLGPPDECITAWFRDHGPPGRGKPDQMKVECLEVTPAYAKWETWMGKSWASIGRHVAGLPEACKGHQRRLMAAHKNNPEFTNGGWEGTVPDDAPLERVQRAP